MTIYLVRHGESVDDIEDCYGGIADFSLTEGGRNTAHDLSSRLASHKITRVYTSPYKRAYETATIISKDLACEPRVVDDMRERNSYGVLSGTTKEKAAQIFGHLLAKVKGKPGDFYSTEVLPGAEPLDEFNARVKSAFDFVVADAAGNSVICIVTHGNVTRSIYREILQVAGKIGLDLLAITVLDYVPPKLTIVSQEGVQVAAPVV